MTKRKGGLGKGLGALISQQPSHVPENQLRYVPLADIAPNPHQPRTDFESAEAQEKLAELAGSIREHGLIQPLIVTEVGDGRYHLIAGERRWRASQLAELGEVPVVVKEATPQKMLELAIIENVQRADLNPIEEAVAYQQLSEGFGLTQEEVADRVGKARTTVTNLMRLLRLPTAVQTAVINRQISGRHARELLRLPEEDGQIAALKSIVNNHLNVQQTEVLVGKLLAKEKPQPKQQKSLPAEYKAAEDRLRETLGAKVELQKSGQRGKIIIHFENDEDLNDIYGRIIGPE